jgi:hypothetical protein
MVIFCHIGIAEEFSTSASAKWLKPMAQQPLLADLSEAPPRK